jgi:hypothetical protein
MKTAARKLESKEPTFRAPSPNCVYAVRGYHTGEFIARCEWTDNQVAELTVIDPLRPFRKGSCPYPRCVGEEDHDGAHVFPTLCAGHRIQVPWRLARFEAPPLKVIEFPAVPSFEPRGAA